MAMAAAQIRGSAAPATARRWPAPPRARPSRFAPLVAPSAAPASLGRGTSGGLAAGVASKLGSVAWIRILEMCVLQWWVARVEEWIEQLVFFEQPLTTMCMKADYSSPVDPITSLEQAVDEIQEPAVVPPANEEINIEQEVTTQQKCAKIHDFCLGIPFGGFLFSMGLIGFLFWRSPVSLTFGVAPGLAILALGVLSLKVWRSGQSSLPFILAQAAVAAAVAWKHCQAYSTTKKLLPWGFYAALSAAMICFYSYVLLAGGNPPPKKAAAA